MTEQWRKVPGYADYSVSDAGRLRRDVGNSNGGLCCAGRIMKGYIGANGYERFTLYKDGDKKYQNGHSLVASAFIGERGEKQVNHKNGIKSDNRLSNLEYVTPSQNIKHAYAFGLARGLSGSSNPMAVLNESSAEAVHILHEAGCSNEFIARALRTDTSRVAKIIDGTLWANPSIAYKTRYIPAW